MTPEHQDGTSDDREETSHTDTPTAQTSSDASSQSDGDDTVPGTTDERGMPVDNPSG